MNKFLSRVDPLVTTKWLAERILGKSVAPSTNVRVLDGTTVPGAEDVFDKAHIPSAQFFDIDECKDTANPYPRMVPKPRIFEDYIGSLGISNKSHVIVYDVTPAGFFSAPRVWWMFRYFGHDAVSVVNGGLPRWMKDGFEVTSDYQPVVSEIFKAQPRPHLLKVYEDMEKLAKENCESVPVVDLRGSGSFESHIKGSTNIPLGLLSDAQSHEVLTPNQLKDVFSRNNIEIEKPFVTSCNAGVIACAGAFAAYLCGNEDVPVYDGSWQEWVNRAPSDLISTSELTKFQK